MQTAPPLNVPSDNGPSDYSRQFDRIYLEYFTALHRYAFTLLQDEIQAEEMVHQVFLVILEKKRTINIHTSLKAYLYRSVHNECLNYLKHEKVKINHQIYATHTLEQTSAATSEDMEYKQLRLQLKKAIAELPSQCRTIFELSRFEEMKYAEIAAVLGLSVKTVEAQMSKALKRLRIQLIDYLPLILWTLIKGL